MVRRSDSVSSLSRDGWKDHRVPWGSSASDVVSGPTGSRGGQLSLYGRAGEPFFHGGGEIIAGFFRRTARPLFDRRRRTGWPQNLGRGRRRNRVGVQLALDADFTAGSTRC